MNDQTTICGGGGRGSPVTPRIDVGRSAFWTNRARSVPIPGSLSLQQRRKRDPGIEIAGAWNRGWYSKMAKVRRSRRKFHLAAVKPKEKDKTDALMPNEVDKSFVHMIIGCAFWNGITNVNKSLIIFRWQSSLPAIFPIDGLFNPKRSSNSETTGIREAQKLQVSKKDKRKERHERFLQSRS